MLQVTRALSLIEASLAGLVHPSVEDGAQRPAHERFIVSRMVAGCLGLACLPGYLLWRGVPSVVEVVAAFCVAAPAVAAFIVSRTGRLTAGYGIASLSSAVLIAAVAVSSEALGWPVLLLLAAVPLEAVLSGSRRVLVLAIASALAAGLGAAAAKWLLIAPDAVLWTPRIAVTTLGFVGLAQLAGHLLVEAEWGGGAGSVSRAVAAYEARLLEAIDDLVTWHDRSGGVTKACGAAGRLIGVAGPALNGQGLLSHVHVSDRPAYLKALSDAALGDRPVVVPFRLHRSRSGSGPAAAAAKDVIWAEMRAVPVKGSPDHAVMAVIRDVSAHRGQAEELEAALAKAESADGTKARFLATVSHELRTPLNAIIGFSDVMAGRVGETMPLERHREYAGIIHESGQHLLGVVNTLLDMSKIEAGEFDFAPEPFDVAALTHGCCDLMHLKAQDDRVAVERRIAANLPEIVADRRAYRQILINLLSNALKFTPAGGHVTVSVKREVDRLLLVVADDGIGIPGCDLPRIGDPFFQSQASYDRRHEGTGLGLSVVRGLLGLHRGTLAIDSAPGQGTTVSVTLPFDCRSGTVQTRPVTVRATTRAAVIPAAAPMRKSA